MIDTFLLTIAVVGAWNLGNFIARIFYKEISYKYTYHIFMGAWATFIIVSN